MQQTAPLTVSPEVSGFFDERTHTISYVVADTATSTCAIIDSVLDYEPHAARLYTESADKLVSFIAERGYAVVWILETHVHADHLSAAPYLQEKLGGKIGIGSRIREVQDTFGKVFNAGTEFARDGSQFDELWKEGDTFTIGSLTGRVLETPGHTPADVTYVIGDTVFVGDTLFMPDYGTARCDFPGGSSEALFDSVQKIYALPDETRMFLCHDYLPEGREAFAWETTVEEQKRRNLQLREGTVRTDFSAARVKKDATLGMPKLIIPSIQVNMRAGHLPEPDANGISYLRTPVNGAFAKK